MEEKYEITYLTEEGKVVDIKKILEENQAKIDKETDLGIRGLAYPIGKVTRARYFAIKFFVEPSGLVKLEKTLRLNKEIVRYLIVKNPPETQIKTIKAPTPPPAKKIETPAKPAKIEEPKIKDEAVKKEPELKVESAKKPIKQPIETTKAPEPKKSQPTPKKAKPVKIAKDELDKKLKELTLD